MRWLAAVLVTMLFLGATPGAANADDEPNTTCRIDAMAEAAAVVAHVTCLQLDVEKYGEMDGAVTVTLQRYDDGKWASIARETCTDTSTKGVLALRCAAENPAEAGSNIRGLIDLDKPKDWGVAVASPRYLGGDPRAEALALDDCDVNEVADASDLTLQDAPWADICAVFASSSLTGDDVRMTVAIDVFGGLEQRLPTSTWAAELNVAGGCNHQIVVADTGGAGTGSSWIDSRCGYEPGVCTGIWAIIEDVTNGACSTTGTWESYERVALPADAVDFVGNAVVVSFRPKAISALVASDFASGSVIRNVSGWTTSGAAMNTGQAMRAAVDGDYADSTGRTYTIKG